MKTDDAFDPFDRLYRAVRAAMEPLGVDLVGWAVLPGDPADDDRTERACQMAFRVRPEAFEDDQAKETRRQFEEMMDEQRVVDHDEKLDREVRRIKETGLVDFSDGGIFPDSPEE